MLTKRRFVLTGFACEKRRNDLRAAIDSRNEFKVRRLTGGGWSQQSGVASRPLLKRQPAHGRQLLREMLAGPITFTPAGRVYRFRGEASFGALAGEVGVSPCVVPVRGYVKGCSVKFKGIAA